MKRKIKEEEVVIEENEPVEIEEEKVEAKAKQKLSLKKLLVLTISRFRFQSFQFSSAFSPHSCHWQFILLQLCARQQLSSSWHLVALL